MKQTKFWATMAFWKLKLPKLTFLEAETAKIDPKSSFLGREYRT